MKMRVAPFLGKTEIEETFEICFESFLLLSSTFSIIRTVLSKAEYASGVQEGNIKTSVYAYFT